MELIRSGAVLTPEMIIETVTKLERYATLEILILKLTIASYCTGWSMN